MKQDQRVAVITGGSRGIGKAISKQLASEGIIVAVNYSSNQTAALETVDEIRGTGGEASAFQANVADPDEVQNMMNQILNQYGRVDILVNNAGIIRDRMFFMMKETDWKDVISVNLIGTLLCARSVLKPMIKARGGKIINISSIGGIIGMAGQTNYATSKAAVIGFTKSLAKEVASYNITVNTITAGYVETDMIRMIDPKKLDQYQKSIPLHRFAAAEEIAKNVSYLLSPAAEYVTGQIVVIDGGVMVT